MYEFSFHRPNVFLHQRSDVALWYIPFFLDSSLCQNHNLSLTFGHHNKLSLNPGYLGHLEILSSYLKGKKKLKVDIGHHWIYF
jgi:hypothetical protein